MIAQAPVKFKVQLFDIKTSDQLLELARFGIFYPTEPRVLVLYQTKRYGRWQILVDETFAAREEARAFSQKWRTFVKAANAMIDA